MRIPLRVLDADRRDLHRGIARLDPEAMERHGIMEETSSSSRENMRQPL